MTNTSPELIVSSRSGSLRAHLRPSIASAAEQAEAYAGLLPLIAGGEIEPAFDRFFSLEDAPEALRHLIEDRPFGKVTLTPTPSPTCAHMSGRLPPAKTVAGAVMSTSVSPKSWRDPALGTPYQ